MLKFASLPLYTPSWLRLPRWRLTANRQSHTNEPIVDQKAIRCHCLAWHRACRQFVQRYPQWAQRRFDEEFLLQFIGAPTLPTAAELALAWDRQFGPMTSRPAREQQVAELLAITPHLLRFYHDEHQQL